MSKILMIGNVPPPMSSGEKIEASHYRTWQFLQPLIEDQHIVHFCASTQDMRQQPTVPENWQKSLVFHSIQFGKKGWRKAFQQLHDETNPDCIVAVNYQACQYATRLKSNAPIWMDLYGDQLTIMQLTFYRHSNNRGLHTTISFMRDILLKGDVFSACGIPQEHMTVGELAMTGRLNNRTMGYPFTRAILPGSPPSEAALHGTQLRPLLQQVGIKQDDFVVLWCGGYNAWTDIEILFAGLEKAMAADDRIHYVSIGASTYPSPNNMYNQFQRKIESSPHADRYHLLGWLPWSAISSYYSESNVGVNIDGLHYETIYGTRTRLLEMMANGMPIVTSEGTELSYLLRDKGVALTFESGNWEQFGENLIQLAVNRELYRSMVDYVSKTAQQEFSFRETTRPLREWVQNPVSAPDKAGISRSERMQEMNFRGRSILRRLIWRFMEKE
jgi:glycosyltransferase involved in cell wall biosynthesis